MRIENTPDDSRARLPSEIKPEITPKIDFPSATQLPSISGQPVDVGKVLHNVEILSREACPIILKQMGQAVQKQGSLYVFGQGHDFTGPISAVIKKATEI